ncbi:MAG: DNA internalization-related competence protein ComEC/Rec2 [Vicinamibacterales bacterium]
MPTLFAPVAGLALGAALGLAAADLAVTRPAALCAFVAALATAALLARAAPESRWLTRAIGLAFALGGVLLADEAWERAWRPTLLRAFESALRATPLAGPLAAPVATPSATPLATPVAAPLHAGPPPSTLHAIVTGVIAADAVMRERRASFTLSARSLEWPGAPADGGAQAGPPARASPKPAAALEVEGGIAVSVGGDTARWGFEGWRRGRTVRVPVLLRRPLAHRNPGMAVNEVRSLARRGIVLVGTVKSGALVEVIERGSMWSETCADIRGHVRRLVAAHVGRWDPAAAAVVAAILIGDRAGLTADATRRLQEAGTYHTVAISGGNIALLAALTVAVFRWSGVLGRAAMLTAMAGLLAYGEIVEGGASVTRAIVTAIVYFGARALDHRIAPAQALLLAAGVLVAHDPLAVMDPGFLLSFGATAGIVLLLAGEGGRRPEPRDRGGWRAYRSQAFEVVKNLVVTSAAAEAALLPVVAWFFGRVTIAGLALNVVAIPAMAVAQVAGLLLVPAAFLSSTVAAAVGWVAAVGAGTLLRSAALLEWVPQASWRVAYPSGAVAVLYYLALGTAMWSRRYARVSLAPPLVSPVCVAACCGLALWIAGEPWTFWAARGDGRLHVLFLDVGQGDAAFLRFPLGETMVVDAGGSRSGDFDVGDRIVAPVLKHFGVRRLDTLVLSHGDQDHVGGAATIVRDFGPSNVWEGVPVPGWPPLARVRSAADDRQAEWTRVLRGHAVELGGVQVRVEHPEPPDWERPRPRNDDSVVIDVRWRDVSILLAGDIEADAEGGLAARLEPARLRILKVPHHGSRTSSTEAFVRAARPRVAVISAGRDNPFGHPAREVLGRYARAGAITFQTAVDGAVSVSTDGFRATVSGYGGRVAHLP